MTSDKGTLDFYNDKAGEYAASAHENREKEHTESFLAHVPAGGAVLDLGCGSGWAAAHFAEQGFVVTAMDGSQGLADEARARYGVDVIVQPFEKMEWENAFDGIWAWFTLMHAPRDTMDANLARVARAIKPGGQFMIGFQEGDRDFRDSLGRHYSYYTEADMRARLERVGFTVRDVSRRDGQHFEGTPTVELAILAHA